MAALELLRSRVRLGSPPFPVPVVPNPHCSVVSSQLRTSPGPGGCWQPSEGGQRGQRMDCTPPATAQPALPLTIADASLFPRKSLMGCMVRQGLCLHSLRHPREVQGKATQSPPAVNPSSQRQITTAVAGAKMQTSEPAGRDGSLLPRSPVPEVQGGGQAAAGATGEVLTF